MSIATTYENYSHDWHTPPEWLEWVTKSLGEGWFDPCPAEWRPGCASGLEIPWSFPAFVNHPGSRGSAAVWWRKYHEQRLIKNHLGDDVELIWCAFSVEQLRHMRPSPLELPGTLIAPRARVPFIWGGPTMKTKSGVREHGKPAKSPGNWTVFWASAGVRVAPPPHESIVVPTGTRGHDLVFLIGQ